MHVSAPLDSIPALPLSRQRHAMEGRYQPASGKHDLLAGLVASQNSSRELECTGKAALGSGTVAIARRELVTRASGAECENGRKMLLRA